MISLCISLTLFSIDPGTTLVRANEAYAQGKYAQAAQLYQELVDSQNQSGLIYYNLGNALIRNGQLGKAIASYIKAQSLTPRHADLNANLKFARKSTKDKLEPKKQKAIYQTLLFWHYQLSKRELLFGALVSYFLFWLLWLVRLYRPSDPLRWMAMVCLIVFLASGGSFLWRWLLPSKVAVISAPQIKVYSGTDRKSIVRFKLHAGTETVWLESRNDWHRIELSDGKQGWVAASDIQLVSL